MGKTHGVVRSKRHGESMTEGRGNGRQPMVNTGETNGGTHRESTGNKRRNEGTDVWTENLWETIEAVRVHNRLKGRETQGNTGERTGEAMGKQVMT